MVFVVKQTGCSWQEFGGMLFWKTQFDPVFMEKVWTTSNRRHTTPGKRRKILTHFAQNLRFAMCMALRCFGHDILLFAAWCQPTFSQNCRVFKWSFVNSNDWTNVWNVYVGNVAGTSHGSTLLLFESCVQVKSGRSGEGNLLFPAHPCRSAILSLQRFEQLILKIMLSEDFGFSWHFTCKNPRKVYTNINHEYNWIYKNGVGW